ncbi:YlxR family protein [Candidatus Phytoplasma melaleucae]|uniref:YlxR family protein n=1 Tax=Candidatus Phytoplasma melaleucae TaxID=2982630 RepID=A0ABT9DCY9_9MOLU|nr:YlxR family protein ['Melaleuca sp.' phytoplasma]MDO8167960.1 YlxR family protein ['Melaleuca sp.' phytoplasma]MDV3205404.1 YlxR family protein [Weeping tea tree witches'-broom phytoplasma]
MNKNIDLILEKNILRTCIVSRRTYFKKDLLRIVVSKNKIIYIDLEQNIQGRGAYFILNKFNVLFIQRKKILDKKLKVYVPINIYQEIWQLLDNF